MLFAVDGTGGTGFGAHLQHPFDDRLVAAGPPPRDRSGGRADIGAVQIEPDALGEVVDPGLAQTGVGADSTGGRTGVGVLDRPDKQVVGVPLNMGWLPIIEAMGIVLSFRYDDAR